ncbi:MAG: 30S ribosomal protein S20 [Phycisphaerales bacterium]
MANTVSARKRVRQNARRRMRNRWRMKTLRDAIKAFDDAVIHSEADKAKEHYVVASRLLDKTASKGVIHKNNAARRKSRLNARLKKLVQGS